MDDDPLILSAADVTDVVRRVVSQQAPEELEVVDAVADAWRRGELSNRRPRGAPGAAVGFGVEDVLLAQLLFPIVSAAVGQVLGTIALEPGRLGRKRRTAGPGPAGPDSVKAAGVAEAGLPVRLTAEQAENLRGACERHARTLGLSSAKARVLADAVLGALTGR